MQTYLAPDRLEYADVSDLTAWGKAFTAPVTRVELNTSGTKLSARQRVGEFQNVGDLVGISTTFTDSVSREQVPAALPELSRDVVNTSGTHAYVVLDYNSGIMSAYTSGDGKDWGGCVRDSS